MAIDYGTDLSCTADISPYFELISGRRVVVEAIVRRLMTDGLFYDPSYGYDVRMLLSEGLQPEDGPMIQAQIRAQCLADERIEDASVELSLNAAARSLKITIRLIDAQGPFSLIATADRASVVLQSAA